MKIRMSEIINLTRNQTNINYGLVILAFILAILTWKVVTSASTILVVPDPNNKVKKSCNFK